MQNTYVHACLKNWVTCEIWDKWEQSQYYNTRAVLKISFRNWFITLYNWKDCTYCLWNNTHKSVLDENQNIGIFLTDKFPIPFVGAVPTRGFCGQKQWSAIQRPVPGNVQGQPQLDEITFPRGQPCQSQPEEASHSWISVQSLREHTHEELTNQEPQLY